MSFVRRASIILPLVICIQNAIAAKSAHLSGLPAAAQSKISSIIGQSNSSYYARQQGTSVHIENAAQALSANFTPAGFQMRAGSMHFGMTLLAYGHAGMLKPVAPARPKISTNGVEYDRGVLSEWYENGPFGLEQGFTVRQRPVTNEAQPLTLELILSGVLGEVSRDGRKVTLKSLDGKALYHYSGLSATDRDQKTLPAWMELIGTHLLLKIDDRKARYPLVIDPWIQLAELTPLDVINAGLGSSIAVSGDTVVVGGPGTEVGRSRAGAAFVFVKPPTGWQDMTQTAELTASDGKLDDLFGQRVAIAGDTIAVGAPTTSPSRGAVYVFVKPPGGWVDMTETAKLNASDDRLAGLGFSLAIDGDGDVIAAGASVQKVYVFVKPPKGWKNMTQSARLTPSTGPGFPMFGFSVAVDGDGETIVVGAPGYGGAAAYLFIQPEEGWRDMTETSTLTASDTDGNSEFGVSSAIGNRTVVIGDIAYAGAYVFVRPRDGWKRYMIENAKLTPPGSQWNFAYSVGFSRNTVVVGSALENEVGGAVYVYVKPKTGWVSTSKYDAKLERADGQQWDWYGICLSLRNKTLVVGAPGVSPAGAAFVYGNIEPTTANDN